jgi:hypothetical protein
MAAVYAGSQAGFCCWPPCRRVPTALRNAGARCEPLRRHRRHRQQRRPRQPESFVAVQKFSQEVNQFLVFLPLLRHGPELDYEPALAERWRCWATRRRRLRLRRDVRWHDGAADHRARRRLHAGARARPGNGLPERDLLRSSGPVWRRGLVHRARQLPAAPAEPLAGVPFLPIMPAHLLDTIPPAAMRQAPSTSGRWATARSASSSTAPTTAGSSRRTPISPRRWAAGRTSTASSGASFPTRPRRWRRSGRLGRHRAEPARRGFPAAQRAAGVRGIERPSGSTP